MCGCILLLLWTCVVLLASGVRLGAEGTTKGWLPLPQPPIWGGPLGHRHRLLA